MEVAVEGVGGELDAAVEAVVAVEGVLDGEVAVEEGLVEAAVAVGGEDSLDRSLQQMMKWMLK